jgi:hypothetical protein
MQECKDAGKERETARREQERVEDGHVPTSEISLVSLVKTALALALLLPVPFANALELSIHFAKHGYKFGVATEEEYEMMADAFMEGRMNATTSDCIRPGGANYVRFDQLSRYFGVSCLLPRFVRTFYPANIATIANRGGPTGFFMHECGR